ncbi:hypothetical protein CPB84DRAFT_1782895 [Gymnopilus junonius]|uniref:Uncharacterized protein n=1 Tax=Gymnopilus junonius TaxID=109634 RepID=A0A9P5TKU6_GYMJU|nr:hypothetical protein CPB84DRAFT_1782895 [Gymnopilus junonius]
MTVMMDLTTASTIPTTLVKTIQKTTAVLMIQETTASMMGLPQKILVATLGMTVPTIQETTLALTLLAMMAL